jgi:hypothetical protein
MTFPCSPRVRRVTYFQYTVQLLDPTHQREIKKASISNDYLHVEMLHLLTKRQTVANTIREAALHRLRQDGVFNTVASVSGKCLMFSHAQLRISLRTPFQRVSALSDHYKYDCALLAQRSGIASSTNLPYGLDIWDADQKVFNMEWNDAGDSVLVSFKRGDWEFAICPPRAASAG